MADKRRIPKEQAATGDEVREAVIALSNAESQRLRRFAKFRLDGLGRANEDKDLLQAAITRTLNGQRSWNKMKVDFFGHLRGIIESMTSHEAERPVETAESELIRINEGGETISPLETSPAILPDAHRTLLAKERVEGIERHFKDDPLILLIIDGFKDRMTVSEIALALGVSENDVESGIRKIRRHQKNIETEGKAHA